MASGPIAAAAAAKELQPCLTLCDPIDGTPPGSSVPGILQEKILEWVAISFSTIASWQTDGKKVETLSDFIFLGSKITADSQCSDEIKRHLLLGRKALTNLDNILKSRDITLPTKVRLVKAMAFPVVMYGCESWTIKKAEHQRTDASELWYWRRLSKVPWTARRSALGFLWKE